jgi:hypothetical protein
MTYKEFSGKLRDAEKEISAVLKEKGFGGSEINLYSLHFERPVIGINWASIGETDSKTAFAFASCVSYAAGVVERFNGEYGEERITYKEKTE